jgi:HSP20 family protein
MALLNRRENEVWDPFRDLREMSERMNRAFGLEPYARRGVDLGQTLTGIDWAPSVNISETDGAYMVRADLPDVKKEDVSVKCEDRTLTIQGERKQQKTQDDERFHRVESSYGRFLRSFVLPEDADESGIEATFKDGALSVRVPRATPKLPKARQITVG